MDSSMAWTVCDSVSTLTSFKAYLGTSLCDIWAPRSGHWALTSLVPVVSAALLYGLHVLDWGFPLKSPNSSSDDDDDDDDIPCTGNDSTQSIVKVICGVQGFYNTEPTCDAAANMDRLVFGLKHLNPVAWYKHSPICRESQGAPD